jgi:hypothetical protein
MARCAHCDTPIVDQTTQVVHGDMTYCCANCSAAMEASGSGSDPRAGGPLTAIKCAHCQVPIVDESTMVERAEQLFCCGSCAAASGSAAAVPGTRR